jgi:glycosyltransferase involved in cell wall biosynthesis
MRVLHVVKKLPPLVGGDATAVSALVRAQRRAGMDVQLATYNSDAEMAPEIHRVGPVQRREELDRITWRRVRGVAALRRWAREHLAADRVDVVHAHAVDVGYAVGPAARNLGIRTVLTCHGVWFHTSPAWSPRGRLERLLIRRMRPDAVTSVDVTSVAALRNVGFRGARLVPNGVDLDEFPPRTPRSGTFRFLFAGRHERQKGLDILLRAIAQVRDADGESFLVDIAGEGSLTGRLRAQARSLGVETVVQFCGALPRADLVRRFAAADAFVLPSRFEGLPMAILEAWAAHLPVIATTVGGVLDVCTEETALLVPPEDPHALAWAMLGLLRDPKGRERIAENGHRLVREQYTWDAIAKAYAQVYGSVG